MGLQTSSSSKLFVGGGESRPAVPAIAAPRPTKHIPKARAIQRPRAMAKTVTKVSTVDHYKPRSG